MVPESSRSRAKDVRQTGNI